MDPVEVGEDGEVPEHSLLVTCCISSMSLFISIME
jgi:hypothetical protein